MITPLFDLAYRFWRVGAKFLTLGGSISGVFIIGEYLAWPFMTLSTIFFEAASLTWDADTLLRDIRRFVVDLRDGSLINDLIRRFFWWWDRFRADPYGFINDVINHLFPWWWSFRTNPRQFVHDRINELWPEWNWFRLHPTAWLKYKIETNLGLGIGFFDDPVFWIKRRIYERWPFLSPFFDDPGYWLKLWIAYRLGLGADFFDDPAFWVWRRLQFALDRFLEQNLEWLVNLVSRTLNAIWTTKL